MRQRRNRHRQQRQTCAATVKEEELDALVTCSRGATTRAFEAAMQEEALSNTIVANHMYEEDPKNNGEAMRSAKVRIGKLKCMKN